MMWQPINNNHFEELENMLLLDQVDGICIGFYFEETDCYIRDLDGKKLTCITHYCFIPSTSTTQPELQYHGG